MNATSWLTSTFIWALVSSLVLCAFILLPTPWGWIAIAAFATIFALIHYYHPRYFYRRTASSLLSAWLTITMVTTLDFGVHLPGRGFAILRSHEPGWPVHLLVLVVALTLLILDFASLSRHADSNRNDGGVYKELESYFESKAKSIESFFLAIESDHAVHADDGLERKEQCRQILVSARAFRNEFLRLHHNVIEQLRIGSAPAALSGANLVRQYLLHAYDDPLIGHIVESRLPRGIALALYGTNTQSLQDIYSATALEEYLRSVQDNSLLSNC